MAREIKFRVWNPDHETMYDGPFMFQPSQDYDHVETPFTYYYDWMDFEDGIKRPCYVMQYTGLKDKNGVEIYESDVFHMGDPNILYVVEWFDTGFQGRQISNKSRVGLLHWRDRINVTTNIYQNPELLNTKP